MEYLVRKLNKITLIFCMKKIYLLTIILLLTPLIAGCVNTTNRKEADKNIGQFRKNSQQYYNECRDNGGSQATCESYAIQKQLDEELK